MKIICTEEERNALKLQFNLGHCPFLYVPKDIKGDWECTSNCDECTDKHIKWEIRQKRPKPEFKEECKNCRWVEWFGDKCINRQSLYYGKKVVQWGESFSESQSPFGKCDRWEVNEG